MTPHPNFYANNYAPNYYYYNNTIMSYLHQVVVWAVEFFVQFNDQAFKEGRKLSFLFPRLRTIRKIERKK